MALLGFQKRFAPLVESGEKRQTIRAYRKDGRDPKVSERLHLYTGLRTKSCRKLGESICTDRSDVQISDLGVCIDGDLPPCDERDAMARADGFRNEWEMIEWFRETHGLPFEGVLIEWGDLEASES